MISCGRITIKILIFLWWTATTTTTLLLLSSSSSSSSSSSTQCSAAFVAADEAAADTAEGESIATDAAATTATTNTDAAKKEQHSLRKTWTLFHSVDSTGQANDTSFTPRAKVTLEVPINNEVNKNAKTTPPVLTIENHIDCLSEESVHRMMETEWYQLKLVEDDDDDDNSGSSSSNSINGVAPPPVLATVPACRMRLANFRDELVLTFGTNGHVISLASMPLVSPLAPPNCDDESLLPNLIKTSNGNDDGSGSGSDYIKLESRISFETAVPGMMLRSVLPTYQPPPGLKYLSTKSSSSSSTGGGGAAATDKPPPGVFGQDSKQQQAPPDNTMFGFLSRYWYILAPIVLLQLFQSEPPPPPAAAEGQQAAPQVQQQQQQQGGGGGGTAAVQQAIAAPAQAPQGDGGSARQRRGKRG